jgi:release factor glutamine methyltransferase
MTIAEALREAAFRLRDAGIDNPRLEARLLLSHALDRTPSELLRESAATFDPTPFHTLLARRIGHEPMAYILGHQGFWRHDFLVSPGTLIPRPDSETIVEAALTLPHPRLVLDLGTGTGCLLLSVLHERPEAFGVGVDLAPEAAALARCNAARLGLEGRAAFLCGDWDGALSARFDLVLSNPPYVDSQSISGLMPEVAAHEPHLALDGGADGLDAYRAIVLALQSLLSPGGSAVLELGIGQVQAVAALSESAGFTAAFRADLAGVARAVILRREKPEKNHLARAG